MSLKTFHIFFILVSIVFAFGFGFWCLDAWRFNGAPFVYAVEAGIAFLSGLGLMFYLRGVFIKLKDVSYL